MLFAVILGAVVFATLAMLVRDGVWSNTLALLQILIAGLAAFAFYQPLTVMLDEQTGGQYTYALDLVVIWGVYTVAMVLLKTLSETVSKKRMAFVPKQVDDFVGPLVGLIAGCLLAGFVGATLHMSPLNREALGGAMDYKTSDIDSAPIYALDITWLALVEAATSAGIAGGDDFKVEEFVGIYRDRREKYESVENTIRVERK